MTQLNSLAAESALNTICLLPSHAAYHPILDLLFTQFCWVICLQLGTNAFQEALEEVLG